MGAEKDKTAQFLPFGGVARLSVPSLKPQQLNDTGSNTVQLTSLWFTFLAQSHVLLLREWPPSGPLAIVLEFSVLSKGERQFFKNA